MARTSATAPPRPRPWGRVTATSAAASVALAVLAGCAASGPAALPPGVTVELRQLRSDVADRTAQVRVTNATGVALEIVRVEFDDDRFDGPAVRDRDSTIDPGRTVDLRISLPPAACGADGGTSSRVTLVLADGAEWRADIPDPLGFVDPLHARDCLRSAVDETAVIGWTDFEPGAGSAVLTLGVAPAGGGHDLVIDQVRETNLLQFPGAAGTSELGLAVDGTGPAEEIPVTIVPARCDPHAVMEDKRGTVFTMDLHLDGVAGTIDLAAGDALRGRILAWVASSCGYG